MTYGIIGAMDEEIEILKNDMKISKKHNINNFDYYVGELNNKNIILVKSGIGKVNAAICTQLMITKFDVDLIINTGIAGAIDEKLRVLDIVVAKKCLYHDFDVTAFGYNMGVIPRMKSSEFNSNTKMVDDIMNFKNLKVKKGIITSGDQFIKSKEKKDFIKREFNASCVDMESTAIAHTAFLNDVEFIIIRAISDGAEDTANIDYETFSLKAAEKASKIVNKILEG